MSLRTKVELLALAALAAGALLAGWLLVRGGISAREQPGALETFVAGRMRRLAIPSAARDAANPVAPGPDILAEARAHFADHCAVCHGNDGRGETTIGQNLYPKAPDMTAAGTQGLTDGEIFYIIHNGVRLTGMPAWGGGSEKDDLDSWKLVYFIRHLPSMTSDEIEQMKAQNPVSRRELEEEKEIQDFLEGGQPPPAEHP